MNLLDVKHPETIEKLDTNLSGAKLTAFKNVSCLVTKKFELICKETLLLPRLKELRFNTGICDFLGYVCPVSSLNRMKQTLREFLASMDGLVGPDFKFRFAGFQLTKAKFDEIEFGIDYAGVQAVVSNECVYLKNYHLIDGTLDFVLSLGYSHIVCGVTKIPEIPRCFSKKFTRIIQVFAIEVTKRQANHFLWFLKSLSSLRWLILDLQVWIVQELHDQLPASAPSLLQLDLLRGHFEESNFDFLGKFSHLSGLRIETCLSLESLHSLARHFGKLAAIYFLFQANDKRFSIQKVLSSKLWKVSDDCQKPLTNDATFETEHSSEIVSYLEGL